MPVANSAEWKPVPLVASVNQRYADTSVDGLLTNAYLQKDAAGTPWVRRRAGLIEQPSSSLPNPPVGGYVSLGIMRSVSGSGALYTGGNTVVYKNGAVAYTFTVTPTTNISFDQSTVTTVNEIYASNGSQGAYDPGTGMVQITDSNYPANTVDGSAYLNGYLYVMDTKGSIWGTPNQNDFSVWSSTNVINAWGTSGSAVALRAYLNEILAFKTYSVEVFYDSGNAVGSPLLPVQQISIRWGLTNPTTIQKIDEQIFWVGQSQTSELAVIQMANFNPVPISNESINRILLANSVAGSCSFEMGGDKFYGITFNTTIVPDRLGSSSVLAYNISNSEWSLFTTTMVTTSAAVGVTNTGLGIFGSTFGNTILAANGQVLQIFDSFTFDENHLPSSTQTPKAISLRLRTDNMSMGTSLRKMVSGLRIRADQKGASTLRLRWSDDDYQTWSAWRTIDLSKNVPMLPGLQGTFAKRAYEVEYSGSDQIRFSSLELLIALGDI